MFWAVGYHFNWKLTTWSQMLWASGVLSIQEFREIEADFYGNVCLVDISHCCLIMSV